MKTYNALTILFRQIAALFSGIFDGHDSYGPAMTPDRVRVVVRDEQPYRNGGFYR